MRDVVHVWKMSVKPKPLRDFKNSRTPTRIVHIDARSCRVHVESTSCSAYASRIAGGFEAVTAKGLKLTPGQAK